jgi:cytochrome c peroxidase
MGQASRVLRVRSCWHAGRLLGLYVMVGLSLVACGGGSGSDAEPGNASALSAEAQLGQRIFHDRSLSASGSLSCSGCHVDITAFTADDGLAVPFGGAAMATPGFRNAPSLKYLDLNPSFFFDDEGTPTGGFTRDGRAASLAAQARDPILAAHEMANGDAASFTARLAQAEYAARFAEVFGADVFDDPDTALARAAFALQRYQIEDPEFHPYSSKYDAFLEGKAELTAQELRGLAAYNDPTRGNCAGCHPSSLAANGAHPLFTDFTYDNLGVPRNAAIPANADPAYFDLGLCGPFRSGLQGTHPELCGAFKVPTLRNVALTAPYFHNGRFATLAEALRFYVRRDTHPEAFYPLKADGSVDKFDDLPAEYRKNVNITEVPYNRKPGQPPALDDEELGDLQAFLETLTDGYYEP